MVPVASPYPLVCLRYQPRDLMSDPALDDEARRVLLDRLNAAILAEVNAGGSAFLSHSVIRDGYVMRVSIGNIRTGSDDVRRLWDLLTVTAEKHLGQVRP